MAPPYTYPLSGVFYFITHPQASQSTPRDPALSNAHISYGVKYCAHSFLRWRLASFHLWCRLVTFYHSKHMPWLTPTAPVGSHGFALLSLSCWNQPSWISSFSLSLWPPFKIFYLTPRSRHSVWIVCLNIESTSMVWFSAVVACLQVCCLVWYWYWLRYFSFEG